MAISEIPPGFVLVSSYDKRSNGEHQTAGPTGDYLRILREVQKKSSRIRAFKDRGQYVACEKDVKEFLADLHGRDDAPRKRMKRSARRDGDSVAMDASQAVALFRLLGRIADALECLATKPESDSQTPFGSHLHASTNGDR